MRTSIRILVIEDDEQTAGCLRKGLKEAGHAVDWSKDGRDGLFMVSSRREERAPRYGR